MTSVNDEYQSRFRAYLRFLGKTNGEDVKPHEYIVWISQKWQEWRKLNGMGRWDYVSQADHAAFDKWLDAETGGS